jgi:hypothetical protein
MSLDLSFGGFVIRIRAVEAHPFCSAGLVEVGAQHIPPLAQVQHSVMPLTRPTLWCDSQALSVGHRPYSLFEIFVGLCQPTENTLFAQRPGYQSWALYIDGQSVW